ncbi:hypothetical protein HON22_04130 [Candidatus Peregrinibacteria bacterium]|jgi:hypothetical protein|nr:hypothetical protein [Candidatus Peregrinibacteria bacterium]
MSVIDNQTPAIVLDHIPSKGTLNLSEIAKKFGLKAKTLKIILQEEPEVTNGKWVNLAQEIQAVGAGGFADKLNKNCRDIRDATGIRISEK